MNSININNNILIVEDDSINSMLISEILKKANYNVTIAANGKEAVDLVENNKKEFSLIIMDIKMPIMNGYDACLLIKEIANIPIIAHTADVYFSNSEKYKKHNFDKIIFKPSSNNHLIQTVNSFLSRKYHQSVI